MTKRQYKRAIALIKKDCQINGRYVDQDGNTCAIGCLALDAGVREATLLKKNTEPIYWFKWAYLRIKSKFGLDLEAQEQIQSLNDTSRNPKSRRRKIVHYLKSLLP